MITKAIRVILLGSMSALPMVAAHAQTVAPAAAEAGTEVGSEDIIVTARKRAERLIDVPVAVTALDDKALARYATADISAVGTQIPQVMFTRNPSGNGANINIRGVGTNTSADDGVEQAVSVNIDGVPTARGRILQTGLFDIGNVQVLKGPQALYFGKNSPGGVIVIESKGPTDQFEGYVRAGYEFQAHEYAVEGAFGGPISETLGFRVAVRGSDMREGYVRNVAQPISAANNPVAYDRANGLSIPGGSFKWGPNAKQIAGRVTLRWEPTSDFDATFKGFYSYYKDQGDSSQNVIASCVPGAALPTTTDLSAVFVLGAPRPAADPNGYCGGDRRINTIGELPGPILAALPINKGDSAYNKNNNYLSSLVMNYRLDQAVITSTTGFYNYRNIGNAFFDSNSLSLAGGAGNSYNTSWSQELRVDTKFDGMFNITGGLFYGHDKRLYRTGSYIIRDINPLTGSSATSLSKQNTTGNTYSAFAEISVKFSPELEFNGGARYTRETKRGTLFVDYTSTKAGILGVAAAQGTLLTGRLKNNNVAPQATLTWHPTTNSTLYMGYRTGFKAGAITNPGLVSRALNNNNIVLRPEKVKGYEAGFKFQSDDRRFSGDMAIYHYTYRDLQVSAFDSVSNTVITQNAGGAQVDGIEGNVSYRLIDGLTLRAAAGYNRARYTTFTNAACWGGQAILAPTECIGNKQNLTGEPLPRAPDWSGTVGASYETEISQDLKIGFTVDGRYSSRYNFISTNNPFAIQKGYTLLDGSVRLASNDERWELALIGRNLTNKFYFTVGSERPLGTSPGSVQGVPGLPRTLLVQGTFNF
jgi:iron complex outermembrane receptor protein